MQVNAPWCRRAVPRLPHAMAERRMARPANFALSFKLIMYRIDASAAPPLPTIANRITAFLRGGKMIASLFGWRKGGGTVYVCVCV